MPDGVIAMPFVELNTPGMGKLQPILWVRDHDRVHPTDPSEFPNDGTVLMSSQFHALLRDHPLRERLVRIAIDENRYSSLDESQPSYARYMVKGAWQRVPKWMLQHVVAEAFDPKQPPRQLALPFEPEHPLWIRDPLTRAYFGPFVTNAQREDDRYLVELIAPTDVPWSVPGGWPRHGIAKVTDLDTIDVEGRTFAINTFDRILALGRRIEWLDFIDDAQLVAFLRKAIGDDGTLPASTFASLTALIARLPTEGAFDQVRLARATALIERVASWETRWDALVQRHLESDAGRQALRERLVADPELIDARVIQDRHPKVLERLGTLAKAIAERQAEADALQAHIDELQRFDRGALERKRHELTQELADVTERVERAKEGLGLVGEIASLQHEHARLGEQTAQLRLEADRLEREVGEWRATHEQLRTETQRHLSDLRGRLTELKPYVDVLTGGAGGEGPRQQDALPAIPIDPTPPASLTELLDLVHGRLAAMGHEIGREEAANALTALITSPLTVLAGLPGVGKTSLVTRLAEAVGMVPHAQFLTVRVPRGWRGRHDVIGYPNPITGHFEEAPTGIYPFLRLHGGHPIGVPGWILFDEANLSPPEHYLSEWLGLMDEGGDRSLLTGRPGERLTVPKHVRLVFTINQDHTVETLSPRLLDRAAVVVVRASKRIVESVPPVAAAVGTPTAAALDRLLANVPTELPEADRKQLDHLIERMGDDDPKYGRATHVSIRKRSLAQRHALTLRDMLGRGAGAAALDHAVATHLIPLLRGSGASYRARLEILESHLGQMRQAHTLLKQILAIGAERFDEYDFHMLT